MSDAAAYRGGCYFDLDGRFVGLANMGVPIFDMESPDETVFATAPTRLIAGLQSAMVEAQMVPPTHIQFVQDLSRAARLAATDWTSGDLSKSAFKPLTEPLGPSVVTLLNAGLPIGYGTVIDEDGLAVVKATTLTSKPQCRLPDESVIDVDVVCVDKLFDLAFIRLPKESVRPIPWTTRDKFRPGTIVAAVGADQSILVMGIVSVDIRDIVEDNTKNYELPLRVPAQVPGLYGEYFPPDGFLLRNVRGLAKTAGLKFDDRLISIAGISIKSQEDLNNVAKGRLTGDVVRVVYKRGDETITVDLPLEAKDLYSGRTYRNRGFPVALEYSLSVPNTGCGSPLIDLNGDVIGITIGGPEDRVGYAIPRDSVLKLLQDAKAGKLQPWPATP